MPILQEFHQFGSLHWETGALASALACQGVRAPHTGEPYSEAMLLGLSRGIGVMYATFAFAGREPYFFFSPRHVRVGGDPIAELCQRLGVTAEAVQIRDLPETAGYLEWSLAAGLPVIVWADRSRLPWGWAPTEAGPWMAPVLVYGLEDRVAYVADRARVPLACPVDELDAAAGAGPDGLRKLMTLRPGQPVSLPDLRRAAADAIAGCVDGLITGPTANFGIGALGLWANDMLDRQDAKGWKALFRTDRMLYDNLIRAYLYIELEGTGGGAARPLYAAFLEEAAELLHRPELNRVAGLYRDCGALWSRLAATFLPAYFRQTRALLEQREARFRGAGLPGSEENRRLAEVAGPIAVPAPEAQRSEIRRLLLELQGVEQNAVMALASAVR